MLYKRFKAVLLYLLLAVKPQKLLNLKLNGKSVRIPSCFTGNHIALHCAVTGNHILYYTGKNMANVRLAVCGRRTVIENIRLTLCFRVYTFFKYFFVFPEFFNLFLFLNKVKVRGYTFIHLEFTPFKIKKLRPIIGRSE